MAMGFGFLAGIIAVIFVPVELAKMSEARSWSSREARITHSSISERRDTRKLRYWEPVLGGVYADNGEKFWISKVRFGDFRFGGGKAKAKEDAAKYPVGARVTIYYSPSEPKSTILEPFAPWDTMIIMFAVGASFVALPFLLYALRRHLGMPDATSVPD